MSSAKTGASGNTSSKKNRSGKPVSNNKDIEIVIVDDMQFSRVVVQAALKKAGFINIRVAASAKQALNMMEEKHADVVLADWVMPEMDGPSFLEVIRSYLRIQSLPVVVFTGLAESPMAERARSLHVNSILIKGKASPEDVLKALEEALVRMPN